MEPRGPRACPSPFRLLSFAGIFATFAYDDALTQVEKYKMRGVGFAPCRFFFIKSRTHVWFADHYC